MHQGTAQDIHRVQRDLATMRDALGTGYPFDRTTVAAWLAIAAVSALGATAAWIPSSVLTGVTFALGLALISTVTVWTLRLRRSQATAPTPWREVRAVSMAKLLAGPPLLAFLAWQFLQGVSGSYLLSTTAFWGGLVTMIYATTQPWRRVGFGLAIPLLIFGAAVPGIAPEDILLAAACTGVTAGLACASIISVQMRSLTAPPPR